MPALRTRKALRALADGDRLEVACTDQLSVIDIPHLLRQTGDALEGMEEKDGVITFRIMRVKRLECMSVDFEPAKPLAAVVFENGEDANRIMADFAAALAAQGARLGGFVQISEDTENCGCKDTYVLDLQTGARTKILQDLGAGSQGCRVDPSALVAIGHLVSQALAKSPDLIIINRFGKLESEGMGLRAEVASAALSGIPTLVCVSTRYLADWRSFAADMSNEIACTPEALLGWWQQFALSAQVPAAFAS